MEVKLNQSLTEAKALRWEEFHEREVTVREDIGRRIGGVRELLELQLDAARRAHSNSEAKVIYWARKAAATFGDAAAPIAACTPGCSACCHVPVMLLASEARVIGREIGRMPKVVPPARRNTRPPAWQGADYACPFLLDNQCSIYASRPLPCRLLFNLDRDALLCQHGDKPNLVPYADARLIELRVVEAARITDENEYVAELRDFFA